MSSSWGVSHGFPMDFPCFFPGEDEDQYEQFMLPLTAAFEAVAQMFSTNSFNEQEAKVSGDKIPSFPTFLGSFPRNLGVFRQAGGSRGLDSPLGAKLE